MDKLRKTIIILATIIASFIAYFIYNAIVKTPGITPDKNRTADIDIPNSDFTGDPVTTDGVQIGNVGASRFVDTNDETGKIERVFGYEKLLNPGQNDQKWKLLKPYMTIYSEDATLNIVSDGGDIQVETAAGMVTPTEAALSGNVKITIISSDPENPMSGNITMDDLVYNSERSEFATQGPVKIVSDRGEMIGTGMVLIYNDAQGRLEYLQVTELGHLKIFDVSGLSPAKPSEKTASKKAGSQTPKVTKDKQQKPAPIAEPENLYQCILNENVVIKYGDKLVVVGSDQVSISNMLFDDADPDENTEDPKQPDQPGDEKIAAKEPKQSKPVEPKTDNSETVDVIVTCDKGIVIKPMTADLNTAIMVRNTKCLIEMSGSPVAIKHRNDQKLNDQKLNDYVTVAQCGNLKYNVDDDILDLFTGITQDVVALSMVDSDAILKTEGSVKWDRKANNALVSGPGKMLVSESNSDKGLSEMTFDGIMKLCFAEEKPTDAVNSMLIESVNLVGGMAAKIDQQNKSNMSAENATFLFDKANNLTKAVLNENVNFTSGNGRIDAGNAEIMFAKNDAGESKPVSVRTTESPVLTPASSADAPPSMFTATAIDYDIKTGNALAHGPVQFTTYVTDPTSGKIDNSPTVVTAKDNAEFLETQNKIVFNGDVKVQKQTDSQLNLRSNTITGQKLTVFFTPPEQGDSLDETFQGVKGIAITGPMVEMLSTGTDTQGIQTGITRLRCRRIDYEHTDKVIIAKGPGNIQVDNTNVQVSENQEVKKLDMKQPCYAQIKGFDNLKWYTEENRVIASSKTDTLNIDYWPVIDGKDGDVTTAATPYMEAIFKTTPEGKTDFVKLTAKNGIYFAEGKKREFFGDKLVYDAHTSIITVTGTNAVPCIYNNVTTDKIIYNTDTEEVKTQLSTSPSSIDTKSVNPDN